MPAGRVSMQMTLASQGRSASALTGAIVRQRHRDAGIRAYRRPRSARLRRRDPRQRRRAGDRRHQIAPDRRAGAVGRRAAGRVGANSVHDQGRPASRRRHHARGRRRPRHHVRRLRYSRRPGRHSRHAVAPAAAGPAASRPEIQLFAAGSPDALDRTVDVAALSSWLAVRAIDRETRRLDSIERGEPHPR